MLLGLAPLVVQTAARASVGGLDVLVALSGAIGLLAWLSVGYLAGSVLPARTGAALTLFGGLLVTVALPVASDALTAGGAQRSLYSFAPVWGMSIPVGWQESSSTAAFRSVLAATVVVAAVMVTLSLDDTSRPGGVLRHPALLLPLGAPAVLVVVALVVQPRLLEPRPSAADVCSSPSPVSVCLSDEEESLMPTAVSAVDDVLSLVGPQVSVGRLVWAGSVEHDSPGVVVTGGDRPTTQADYRAMFVRDFSSGATGVPACWARAEQETASGESVPAELSDAWAASVLVASSLQVRLGASPSDPPVFLDADAGAAAETYVASLDDHGLRLLIEAHRGALSTCRSSLADVTQ